MFWRVVSTMGLLAQIGCAASVASHSKDEATKVGPTRGSALRAQTESGPIDGKIVEGNVHAFLGIPYAAPPLGSLRWRPPQKVEPWVEPRDATHVGAACPQLGAPDYARVGEDCLTLNVWVPPGGAAKKPVMVWITGGAFAQGSGGYLLYDGARLAAREDVIVVTLNYRIGPLGFMAHPDLAREAGHDASPSYGLLDQRAGLSWVQRNIAAWGGDSANVTIFGQSAGAFSICSHLAMPASRGLFARAIMQSGSCADPLYFGPREAEEQGQLVAKSLGCSDVECLRTKDADAILRALPLKKGFILSPGVWWGPVVDGTELPSLPIHALRAGRGANVPLLVGWNQTEGTSHVDFESVSADERDGFVRDAFGEQAVAEVAARYARATPKESLSDLITDGAFACAARRAARAVASLQVPVYVYEWRRALDNPRLHKYGPTHSVELWFLFGNEEAGVALSPRELPLSHEVMDAWGRFARVGDPSGPHLRWPRYTGDAEELAVLDVAPSVASHVKKDECDFWDRFERKIR